MLTAGNNTPPATIDLAKIKRLPILISLIIGAFFSILNETLLNIAFNELMIDLQVGPSSIQWLSTGYLLIVGILVPISALLLQWFTTRQMFLGAMVLFTLGTLVSAIAPDFSVLLIGRLIQALGAGLLLPVMMNTILVLYPPEKRGAAMGSIGLVIMFAPAIGPTLGGLILDSMHWRWLFYLVLPFMLMSIVFGAFYLKNVSTLTKPRVDLLSILLSTLGFGGIVYGISNAGEGHGGWSSPVVYISLIVGVISLVLFIVRQNLSKEPMLNFKVLKSPMFALATVLLIIVMMTLFSTLLLLPIYLQGAMLMTAFATGLIMLPGGVLNGLLSPVTGLLFDKFGPRVLIIPGAALLVIIMWFFTQITLETTTTTLIILHSLMMIAISMIMMPVQTNGMNSLSASQYPHGTAIITTLQQISGAIGVAFFISLMSSGQRKFLDTSSDPEALTEKIEALHVGVLDSFSAGLVFAVIGLILAFFVKKAKSPDAAMTDKQ